MTALHRVLLVAFVLGLGFSITLSETALALPMDGYHAPHDIQRVVNTDTYRQTLPPPAKGPLGPGNTGLVGPAGFRLD